MSAFVESAMAREAERLEKERGEPFSDVVEALRSGRLGAGDLRRVGISAAMWRAGGDKRGEYETKSDCEG